MMSRHMPIFTGASVDRDTVIKLYPGTEPDAVTITLGVDIDENITLTVYDPAALDRLREAAEQGATALRTKITQANATDMSTSAHDGVTAVRSGTVMTD